MRRFGSEPRREPRRYPRRYLSGEQRRRSPKSPIPNRVSYCLTRPKGAPGLGLDLVEIDRVARLARANPRFLARVFSEEEIRYCSGKRRKWQHFAVRFAAKEAVWKALGQPGLALRDIAISRGADGRPGVLLRGRPAPRISVSLTHGESYAAAVALKR